MLFAATSIFSVTSCNSGTQPKQTSKQAVSHPVQQSVRNPITTYDFTDYFGQEYTLKLNEDDKTAQLNYGGKIAYGSYEKSRWGSDLLEIHFEDVTVRYEAYDMPLSYNGTSLLYRAQLDTDNCYLYRNGEAFQAKDPTRRLKVTKQ